MGNGFRDLIATEESLLLGLPPRTQLMDMIYIYTIRGWPERNCEAECVFTVWYDVATAPAVWETSYGTLQV